MAEVPMNRALKPISTRRVRNVALRLKKHTELLVRDIDALVRLCEEADGGPQIARLRNRSRH